MSERSNLKSLIFHWLNVTNHVIWFSHIVSVRDKNGAKTSIVFFLDIKHEMRFHLVRSGYPGSGVHSVYAWWVLRVYSGYNTRLFCAVYAVCTRRVQSEFVLNEPRANRVHARTRTHAHTHTHTHARARAHTQTAPCPRTHKAFSRECQTIRPAIIGVCLSFSLKLKYNRLVSLLKFCPQWRR